MSDVDPDLTLAGEPAKMPVLAKVIACVLIFAFSVGVVWGLSVTMLSGFTVPFWQYVGVAAGGWLLTGAIYGVTTFFENRSKR